MSTTDNNDITSESEGLRGQARAPFEWVDNPTIIVGETHRREPEWALRPEGYYEDISSHRTRTNWR